MLQEVKDYLKIAHNHADNDLLNLIEDGTAVITKRCGSFSIDEDRDARRLVKEYVRYAYNGYAERFYSVYLSDLSQLSFDLWDGEVDEVPDL